jgi:hypothetical protein
MRHEEVARRNFEHAGTAKPPEWRVTMFFYAVVHAANHVLFGGADVRQPYSHDARTLDIERHTELKKIARQYRELLRLSKTARYKAWEIPLIESQISYAETLARDFLTFCKLLPPKVPTPPPPPKK